MEYVVLPSSLYSPQLRSATPRIGNNLARAFGFAIIMLDTAVSAPLFGPHSGSSVRTNTARMAAGVADDRFASLQSPWIDKNAVVVSHDMVESAKVLLAGLPEGITEPHLAPSSEGEIGLSWTSGSDRLEAMLDPDNRLVWITKIDGKFAPGKDVDVLSENDRRAFYAALSSFYERG
jgi:hypothetical protein